MSYDLETLYLVNNIFVVFLLLIDSIVCFVALLVAGYTLVVQREEGEWRVTHSMIVLIPLPLLLRIWYLAAHLGGEYGPFLALPITLQEVDKPGFEILATLPFYLMLSLYSLLIIFWVGLYYREKKVRSYWLANWIWICGCINALLYAIWVGFMIALPLVEFEGSLRILAGSESLFEITVSLLMAAGFVIYVPLIVRHLGHRTNEAATLPEVVRLMRSIRDRVLLASIVCTVALVIRSVALFVRLFLYEEESPGNLVANIIQFIFCETFPLAIILFLVVLPEPLRKAVPSLANPMRRTWNSRQAINRTTPVAEEAKRLLPEDFTSTPFMLKVTEEESEDWETPSDADDDVLFAPL